MKKSMIVMCIAAIVALYFPVAANEPDKIPPVKEIRVVKKADLVKSEKSEIPKEVTPVSSENGDENFASSSMHGGYIIISSAGLLLLIILLILLL